MATLKVKDYLEDGQINNRRLNTLTDCGWHNSSDTGCLYHVSWSVSPGPAVTNIWHEHRNLQYVANITRLLQKFCHPSPPLRTMSSCLFCLNYETVSRISQKENQCCVAQSVPGNTKCLCISVRDQSIESIPRASTSVTHVSWCWGCDSVLHCVTLSIVVTLFVQNVFTSHRCAASQSTSLH